MKCFYHGDLDGRCAAYWVGHHALKQGKTCEFIEIDYKDRFPMEIIKEGEEVWIVDFSIEPEEMDELFEITKRVVWIDHHKTAIEKYERFPYILDIKGLRYDRLAGCLLTYLYVTFWPDVDNRSPNNLLNGCASPCINTGEPHPDVVRTAPYFTRLVHDWDTWTFEYGDETRFFKTGMDMLDHGPSASIWGDLNGAYSADTIVMLVQRGQIAIEYRDQWAANYLKGLGHEVAFEGHKCFAVNLGCCNSEYFKSVEGFGYDIFMPFVYDGKKWTVSLYSKTVDVSEIAVKHGGGGHKGAAGFVCDKLPWEA